MPTPSASAQTRHGLYGGARQRYGSFSGKAEFTPPVVTATVLASGTWSKTTVADGTWDKASVSGGTWTKSNPDDGNWESD